MMETTRRRAAQALSMARDSEARAKALEVIGRRMTELAIADEWSGEQEDMWNALDDALRSLAYDTADGFMRSPAQHGLLVAKWQDKNLQDKNLQRENLRRAKARAAQDHADATRQLAIEDDRDN